jgi:hypothetical protein
MNVGVMPAPLPAATARYSAARWLGYFMLVDLMFLPYFQLLIMPFSLPLVLAALSLMGVRLYDDRYLLMFGIIAFAVFVSVGIASFGPSFSEFGMENLKRCLQLLSSFAYFFYFRWLSSHVPLRIGRVAGWFLLWFGSLAVAFYLNPAGTGDAIRTFYGKLVTSEETLAMHLRFSYQFTDPNTAAYFLLIASSPLLLVKRSTFSLALLAAVLVLLTFITQSKGALLALALMLIFTLYPPATFIQSVFSVRRIALMLVLLIAGYAAFVWLTDIFESNTLLKLAYDRIFESSDQIATGGSRFGVWTHFAENFTALPFGRGFILLIDGESERPHSDFVRILFSYGFVALIPVLVWFFGRIRSWPALVIPAMTAFLINSLIDEQKMLALFLALLGTCIGDEERDARAV